MGNRSSSVQPAGPPPLLSAAVMGDLSKFKEAWSGAKSLQVKDRQDNNVLHALFSCRGRPEAKCLEILSLIHGTDVSIAYQARNQLGCTPLWILVAYGNVELLKEVQSKFEDKKAEFLEMLLVPNHQGDSPLLATSSQGNTAMVRFLGEHIMTPEQFTKALTQANKKGTTPLQIIAGNSHMELLKFLLESEGEALEDQLLQKNAAGLSLFHICSERNAHEVLKTLLDHMMEKSRDDNTKALETILDVKDKNGATGLHVAAFCGNEEAVRVWMEVAEKSDKTVDCLDKMDSQARTPYWLAMVQGRDAIGKLLAEAGVDTAHPNMVKEIEEARKQREERAAARQNGMRPVDGAALLGR